MPHGRSGRSRSGSKSSRGERAWGRMGRTSTTSPPTTSSTTTTTFLDFESEKENPNYFRRGIPNFPRRLKKERRNSPPPRPTTSSSSSAPSSRLDLNDDKVAAGKSLSRAALAEGLTNGTTRGGEGGLEVRFCLLFLLFTFLPQTTSTSWPWSLLKVFEFKSFKRKRQSCV